VNWIDVNKQLPSEGVKVLTYDIKSKECRIDYLVHFEDGDPPTDYWACILIDDHNKVTHWMELPAPPSEEPA